MRKAVHILSRKIVISATVILLIILIISCAGFAVYSKVGRAPFGKLTVEDVESVVMTSYEGSLRFDRELSVHYLKDVPIEGDELERFLRYLNEVRVTFPHEEQKLVYYGGQSYGYAITMKDGTEHTFYIVGESENNIETGYYVVIDGGREPIMKKGTPTYFYGFDGVIYDIRDGEVSDNLNDEARISAMNYIRSQNDK